MITNLEEIVIQKIRQLPVEKQKDVLEFLNLIEQDISQKPTDQEIEKAREILNSVFISAILSKNPEVRKELS